MGKLTSGTWGKIVLIVLLFLALCGALRGVTYLISGATRAASGVFSSIYHARSFNGPFQTEGGQLVGNSVKELDVSWAAGSVNIHTVPDSPTLTTSDQLIVLSVNGRNNGSFRWYTTNADSGGQVLVVEYEFGIGLFGCSMVSPAINVDIAIPESIAKNLNLISLNAATGDYTFDGLECNTALINIASGNLNASSLKANVLELDIASGLCELDMDVAKSAEIQMASGSCWWRSGSTAPESMRASLMSGNLDITLPENTGFDLYLDKASGNVDLPSETMQRDDYYRLRHEGVEEEPVVAMEIDMASGNLAIG